MGSSKKGQRRGERETDLGSYTVTTREVLVDGGLGSVEKGETTMSEVECRLLVRAFAAYGRCWTPSLNCPIGPAVMLVGWGWL